MADVTESALSPTPHIDDVEWPWRTERFQLRPTTLDDVDGILAFRSNPQVQHFTSRGAMTRAELLDRLTLNQTRMARGAEEPMVSVAVVDPEDGRVWGDAMIGFSRTMSAGPPIDAWEGRIGYTLHPDRQGQGWGTELAKALLDIGFGPLGLRRMDAMVFSGNEASVRLLKRVGMRLEGHEVHSILGKGGEWWDDFRLAILREEYASHG